MTISEPDLKLLQDAKHVLENPGITAQIGNVIGMPVRAGLQRLPSGIQRKIHTTLEAALFKVARAAVGTMKSRPGDRPSNKLHTAAVAVSGGVSGFFGPWAMLTEIPITTGIIFRSIADIAQSEGEAIKDPATTIACIEVFALGGTSSSDDGAESGYYAVRAALAQQIKVAADSLAKGVPDKTAHHLLVLVKKAVQRLGMRYTEKLAAQLIPFVGAVGGAAINTIFISHYQRMAKAHFAVRRLERLYGPDAVRRAYEQLPASEAAASIRSETKPLLG